MGTFIHRNGTKYRLWSVNLDVYLTEPMGIAAMGKYLVAEGAPPAHVNERLERAKRWGTSQMHFRRDATRWDTERCRVCSKVHHEFTPRDDDPTRCRGCGEVKGDRAHLPPCKAVA